MLLRILSYNIRRGGSGRENALASVIRDADVDLVVLQEATSRNVVARLATLVGFDEYAASPGRSLAFLSRVAIEDTNGYGHASPSTLSSRSFPAD